MIKIVAHRGACAEAPENTLEAFEKAIDAGADMIEFDVRRAPDGTLVISHDPVRGPGTGLPTLEQTLRFTQGRIQLDVELKEPGCERDSIELLLQYFSPQEFCVTSFLPDVLREIRAVDSRIRTGLIFASWNESMRQACQSSDAGLLVAHHSVLNQAETVGKPLFVWTVDDAALTRMLFTRPLVEGIVTNLPRHAVALRAAAQLI